MNDAVTEVALASASELAETRLGEALLEVGFGFEEEELLLQSARSGLFPVLAFYVDRLAFSVEFLGLFDILK